MLLPSPIVYARTLEIPGYEAAGYPLGGVELFKVEPVPKPLRPGEEATPMKATLRSLSTSRDAKLELQRYVDRDPEGPKINTMGLPGLDFDVPVEEIAHCSHSLSVKCENLDAAVAHNLSYRFILESDRDPAPRAIFPRQFIFAKNATLAAYAREQELAEFRAGVGTQIVVNDMAFAQSLHIEVFFRLNDVIISPTAGFSCGSSRDIAYPVALVYILEEGDILEIFANNISAGVVTFPYRILGMEREVG